MDKNEFMLFIHANSDTIGKIEASAATLHDEVCNQKYDSKPYSTHLKLVTEMVLMHGHLVCEEKSHILPLIFGAAFHDSIEDARMTYNDVLAEARKYMLPHLGTMAAEIVYALTNEKGRNRAERASDKYYREIRETKYAPFVKFCDRYSNMMYSRGNGSRMAKVYANESDEFMRKIGADEFIPKELTDLMDMATSELKNHA